MHINVSDILQAGQGHHAEYTVSDEMLSVEGLTLTEPISGDLQIVGTKDGVLVRGNLNVAVQLECSRCLRTFTHRLQVPLQVEFREHPEEDQFPIDARGVIDLAEAIRQETDVRLPLTQLCQEDCGGIKLKHKKDS